jgi:hypothetical protein
MMNRQHSGSGYGGTGGGGVRNQMPVASNFSFASVGLTPAQAAAIWSGLRVAIGEIQTGNQGVLRFEELYRNAYTLVLHKHGDMLYKGVDEMVVQRMEEVARQVRQASDAVSETHRAVFGASLSQHLQLRARSCDATAQRNAAQRDMRGLLLPLFLTCSFRSPLSLLLPCSFVCAVSARRVGVCVVRSSAETIHVA